MKREGEDEAYKVVWALPATWGLRFWELKNGEKAQGQRTVDETRIRLSSSGSILPYQYEGTDVSGEKGAAGQLAQKMAGKPPGKRLESACFVYRFLFLSRIHL